MFRSWFGMHESCEHCNLKYERAPGYFLGSTYINYFFTAVLLTTLYMVCRFHYEIPNKSLTPWLVSFCVIFPLGFYRFARAIWQAIDAWIDTEDFWGKAQ